MIALLRLIVSILVTVSAVLFALANRDPVPLIWSPFHEPLMIPACLLGLGGILIGFILGGFMVWLNGAAVRRDRRRQRKTIQKLEEQIEKSIRQPFPSIDNLDASTGPQERVIP